MKKILNCIPLPISAVMLSFATLGNILSTIPAIKNIFGFIAGFIGLIILLKIIITPNTLKVDLENPITASVFVTYFMGFMVISTYLIPFSKNIATFIWWLALILNIVTALYVLFKFILPKRKIITSHYVTFVGIVVASVTSPAFGITNIGFIIFIIGFIVFLLLTPLIFKNLFKPNYIPLTANPSKVIVAAPASLCLAGYISTSENINTTFVFILTICAFTLTLLGCYFLLKSIKKTFNPAYSAYTFPLTISALAIKKVAVVLQNNTLIHNITKTIATIELIIAIIVVCFVLFAYIANCCKTVTAPNTKNQKTI